MAEWGVAIVIGLTVICVIILLGFGLCCFSSWIDLHITQANIVQVYKGTTLLFEGKAALITIETGGMTTTVTIYKCLIPIAIIEKVYSADNIVVKPRGE